MKIIASLGPDNFSVSSSVQHFQISGEDVGVLSELPGPCSLSIVKDDGGFFLLRLDEEGNTIADTWHPSLADAKHQAAFEFSIRDADWREVE